MDREEISIRDVSVTIHVVDFKSEPRAMPREMALQFASQKMYLCTISVFRKRRIDWLIWIVSGIENWEKWKYGIDNGKDGNMKTVLNLTGREETFQSCCDPSPPLRPFDFASDMYFYCVVFHRKEEVFGVARYIGSSLKMNWTRNLRPLHVK